MIITMSYYTQQWMALVFGPITGLVAGISYRIWRHRDVGRNRG